MSKTLISSISKNYSKALLEVAQSENLVKEFKTELIEVEKVFESSNDLQIVMKNSSVSISEKIEILELVFGGKINQKILNFIKILVEKHRFNEFNAIVSSYGEMVEHLSNKKTVEVISPIELNFENKSNVLFKLEHKFNCEINPIWTVDDSLIAGLAFRFDDTVIDTSIKAKLENLSKKINR
jgi:F-type H+-transporting ATPase subunit delta